MNILLDTNILINIVRAKNPSDVLRFLNPKDSQMYLSIVSEAEIKSIALKKGWGTKRLISLNDFLDAYYIMDVNQSFLATYAEIDAYSQRLNPKFLNCPFDTPRNMGKNNLWIASLASLFGLKLITTDADFDHLHDVFFAVKKTKPAEFVPFF